MKKNKLLATIIAALLAVTAVSAQSKNILVVYYSDTGTTKKVAKFISEETGATLFELELTKPYTSTDLDWTNKKSRVVTEYENPSKRQNKIARDVPAFEKYDVVFIGYPIWWRDAPWTVTPWVNGKDFGGKTVIPFCTSMSSPMGESGKTLQKLAKGGRWQEGKRFGSYPTESEVKEWVKGLKF